MLTERIEQRVLGALRMLDRVTQSPLSRPMEVSSNTSRVVRNMRNFYVVTHADGLEAYSQAFQQPPEIPVIGDNEYSFEIIDPQKRYLPRMVTLNLPRDPNPANIGNHNSLFTPHDVVMYPSSTARLSHNWSTLRVSVTQGADPQTAPPVQGSLIQILDEEDDTLLASGITDERGEALVIVPGVPVTKFADDDDDDSGRGRGRDDDPPVIVNTLPVRLELSLDAAATWPVNPDLLEENHVANRRTSMDLTLSTGRMEKVVINLNPLA